MSNDICPTTPDAPMTPCEIYVGLRDAYLALLSGNSRVRLRFGERDSWFSKADVPALRNELERYERLCAATDPSTAAQLGCGLMNAAAPRFGHVNISGLAPYRRRLIP